MDATSAIRMIASGDIETNGPTRTDPIPVNWDLVATTTYSHIYLEDGLSIPSTDIDALGEVFDLKIYPNATYWFHPENPYSMIDIRIYDFGDGPGNVGGFFLGSPATRNDMFVDSEDLKYSREWAFEILAHEFQHLLHYDTDPNEDVWLNEGLADLSVRISLGPGTDGVQSHLEAYEDHPDNDLLLWDEGEPPGNIETIADYGRAYSFISYIADHFGGREIIKDIVKDTRNSISSIDAALAEDAYPERFGDVLMVENVANVFDDPIYGGGIYDQGLIDIGIRTYEHRRSSYPSSHTITSTSRYSPYVLKYTSGSSSLAISIDSTSPVEGTLIGTNNDVLVSSVNFTNDGSGTVRQQLNGFGSLYDSLFVLPHTSALDGSIEILIEDSDLEPPETNVMISPSEPDGSNGYYITSPGVQLTTSEGSVVMYSWNSGAFENYTSSLHPPEGRSTLMFYAEGPLGLREDVRERIFQVDTIDPVIEITIVPEEPDGDNGYYITSPGISFHTVDMNDTIKYDLGEGPVLYDEPLQLQGGIWDLGYWASDRSGRTSEMDRREIRVDLSDPDISFRIDPQYPNGESGYYTTQPLITLVPEGASTGWFYIDGLGPAEYSVPFYLEDGDHEIIYYATDPSGAISGSYTEFIKVDTIGPDLSFEFDPIIGDGWVSAPTYLSLSSLDEKVDIFFTIGTEGPFEYDSEVLLLDGNYPIRFWAVDQAGNVADGGERIVRIDTTTPITELILDRTPDSGTWYHDDPPAITFETISEPVSPEITYFSLDGEEFHEFSTSEIDLISGSNTIYFYTRDVAGNREDTRTRDVGIDRSPPVPVFSANRTYLPLRGPVRFSIEGSTDDIEIYRFRIDFGDGEVSDWLYGTEVIHEYASIGDYKAVLAIQDIAGRENVESSSMTIEVLTQEDYDRRIKDGASSGLILIVILMALAAISIVAILIFVMIRKRGSDRVVAAEIEWEEEEGS